MSDAFKRMGVLYGKLGLGPTQDLIQQRSDGVRTAQENMSKEHVPALVRSVLGIGGTKNTAPFLKWFEESNPGLDLQPSDQETALLAGTIAQILMEDKDEIAGTVALSLATAAAGGLRPPVVDDKLIAYAEDFLGKQQAQSRATLTQMPLSYQQQKVDSTLKTVSEEPQYIAAQVRAAFDAIVGQFNGIIKAQAERLNLLSDYVMSLQAETAIHWWLVGGWSVSADKPFGTMATEEIALRAAYELYDKTNDPIGLYSAPALLELVFANSKAERPETLPLSHYFQAGDAAWRTDIFGNDVTSDISDLLSFSAGIGYSATNEDKDDWHAQYKRNFGIDASTPISHLNFAVQVYREALVDNLLVS